MTQKHTPGAWHISYARKMECGYYAAGATHKILPDKYDGKKGLPIASIFAQSKNAEANARLIAAAPVQHKELGRSTVLLEELGAYLQKWNPDDIRTASIELQVKANRAAIAKAQTG